jgi:CRP-like cAMP-binding protein
MSERTVEITALQSTPFFSGLPSEDLADIVDVGATELFEPGQVIVAEGDRGDAMYVVVAGEVRVDVGGRFHILKPGDFFGEMALIAPSKRMATVKGESAGHALRIDADDFQAFLLAHPSVALAMLKAIVLRLREVEQRIDAWMA